MFLRNVSIHLYVHRALHPRRPTPARILYAQAMDHKVKNDQSQKKLADSDHRSPVHSWCDAYVMNRENHWHSYACIFNFQIINDRYFCFIICITARV